jgi:DNA-binding XRE family transcriptional regulator
MATAWPKPKRETAEEVTLSRADWERLRALAEDLDDIAAVRAAEAEDAAFAAALPPEKVARETTFPLAIVKAELDGSHPVKAWRDHRGLTQQALAERSGVVRELIAQIEGRRKQGSVETMDRLARALGVPIDSLVERS